MPVDLHYSLESSDTMVALFKDLEIVGDDVEASRLRSRYWDVLSNHCVQVLKELQNDSVTCYKRLLTER